MNPLSTAADAPLAPFRIAPRFVSRVWGVRDLRPWHDYIAENDPIGEVWLTGDECVVETGACTGSTLAEVFAGFPEAMLGGKTPTAESPLLLKTIFAKDKLSVQVHPDDALAQKYGQPRGKTECWYALAAEPEARVACGLMPGVDVEQVRAAIVNGNLEDSLNVLPVQKGNMIFVDAGTVHAIWPGAILLETQQNCDLTYRMYDYGRPRELHVEKSLEALRLTTQAGKVAALKIADRTILVKGSYFCVEQLPVHDSRKSSTLAAEDEPGGMLSYLFAASGSTRIRSIEHRFEAIDLPTCGVVAIPSNTYPFVVEDQSCSKSLDKLNLLRISTRWP